MYGELDFLVLISKDTKGHVLHKAFLINFILVWEFVQLAKNTYTIIEIAIEIGTTSGFDVLTHPGQCKHIELDFRPCVHTSSRLVVDLLVFLLELRAQVYKVIDNIVAPNSLFVSKAKLITQVNLDELQTS